MYHRSFLAIKKKGRTRMLITLSDVKKYLRVDSADEDIIIEQLMNTAEQLVIEIGRISDENTGTEESVLKTAEMYATAYLYEHREEANHKDLNQTLRCLLFPVRKEVF